MSRERDDLIAAARSASEAAYAPYSNLRIGAALRFADGAVVTGSNVENASYGLSLCAETVAVAKAMSEGRRDGLMAIAVVGSGAGSLTPCGRCRQVLHELATLGGTDPLVYGGSNGAVPLSALLPDAFGPADLR